MRRGLAPGPVLAVEAVAVCILGHHVEAAGLRHAGQRGALAEGEEGGDGQGRVPLLEGDVAEDESGGEGRLVGQCVIGACEGVLDICNGVRGALESVAVMAGGDKSAGGR